MLLYVLLFQNTAGNSLNLLMPLLMMIVIFVFFVIIPQRRQQSQHKKLMESLKEGMEVYTNAGIVGKITKVEDKTIRLMIDEKTFMRVLKSTVAGEYKA
jgi:preprotein translocase subunit YajC